VAQAILSTTSAPARQTVTDGRRAHSSESVPWQVGLSASRKRNDGDRFRDAAVLPSLPKLGSLFLHRVVKLFMGIHHVLMRFLNVVELLLLIRI